MRLLVSLALALVPAAAPAEAPRTTIDTGTLTGTKADGVAAYLGIPFAAPPVGPMRWRAPQPPAAWTGVRDATRYGHDCMQKPFASDAAPLGTEPAEDCLYANVWRPAVGGTALPVLVWIYGGGFVNGGASPPTYSGAPLARRGIVFVSFNYRLGRFGTFAHPALTVAAGGAGLVDFGLADQVAGLRWVQRNVAAFGGDPAKVTIMGESAGGMSVHALMSSPLAAGLFHAAVVESGGDASFGTATPATAQAEGIAFARSVGIAADDGQALAKLRALAPGQVVAGLNLETIGDTAGASTWSSPLADGVAAVDPATAYRTGQYAPVPVMIGATSDDIGGPDGIMIAGARTAAGLLAACAPVWAYRFSYVATSARTPATKGAAHATDIPFFLDTADVKYGAATTPADRRAARLASDYLVRFVKTGDPNGAGLPRWPRTTPARPATLDLDAEGRAAVLP